MSNDDAFRDLVSKMLADGVEQAKIAASYLRAHQELRRNPRAFVPAFEARLKETCRGK
jgi:hypothetical protein